MKSVILAIFLFTAVMFVSEVHCWGDQHCTWHGTAPLCMPSCSSGKKKIEGTESKCGPNTLICCVTGHKHVCCNSAWEGNAANAMAIAKD